MELAGYTAADADDFRKAISKKQKEGIEKHKKKFIEGAKQNGIDEETALAIFTDWEDFASYGFNKSHAADYGVIAVETGYLKTHYTVEYMTALLSVSKNDSTKITFYCADCRNMGINVLPPDVTSSDWDFTIEDRPEGKPAIRFGLGAVKNIGRDPVELILNARAAGKFKDLNDFIRRVNLQKVGKRSLDCLIRVGALDGFGPRKSLLEVMDNMISISGSHYRAVECGQLSIFGSVAGVEEDIRLPAGLQLDRREQLAWEKELIGLYISDHPITPFLPLIQQRITHLSSQLGEAANREKAIVAGLVTKMRTLTTKNGNLMAFATIDDIQGPVELVIFPKVWEKFAKLVQLETVIFAEGTVDAATGDPKILVDVIKVIRPEEITEEMRNLDDLPPIHPLRGPVSENSHGNNGFLPQNQPNDYPAVPLEPDDWHLAPPPDGFEKSQSKDDSGTALPVVSADLTPKNSQPTSARVEPLTQPHPEPVLKPPVIMAPQKNQTANARPKIETQLITVILKDSGEKDRDVRRMKRVHGLLNSFPGADRFCFLVYEGGQRHLLDFPNNTTGANSELINKLVELVGQDNVQIETV
jgi:DNA polymerase-3 subunit alpha